MIKSKASSQHLAFFFWMVVARAGKLSLEVDLYILLRVLPNSSGKNNIRLWEAFYGAADADWTV